MSVIFTSGFSPPSNSSSLPPFSSHCFDTAGGRYGLAAISCAYVLLILPLCLFILYLGFQRWRRQRSGSPATAMTHSDFFTYNMSVVELVGAFGYLLYYCSSFSHLPHVMTVGIMLMLFTWPGQTLFPVLTCVDQYLAVVHPITYRRLRQTGGVSARNVSTGCVWLTCSVWMCVVLLLNVQPSDRYSATVCILAASLVVLVFCSLSVLRVLIRPGPGQAGRSGKQVDQSKRRAVRTVQTVMAVLWLKFGGSAVATVIRFLPVRILKCVVEALSFLFFLPNGVVLPLMFLHRAGKLPTCLQTPGPG